MVDLPLNLSEVAVNLLEVNQVLSSFGIPHSVVLISDKVLISLASFLVFKNSFDFIFFFSIDKISWWVSKAWSVDISGIEQ